MKNEKETIRKLVRYLNNPDKDGGFWLPNIQRPFVWREDQIERLFDSVLREYPIGTLLVWKTDAQVKRRKFIDNYRHGIDLNLFYVPVDARPKQLVLDGQQRLQSLFIGLHGSYGGKELYFDVLSGDLREPEDTKYKFKFFEPGKAQPPWFLFKDLVKSERIFSRLAAELIARFPVPPSEKQEERIQDNLALIEKTFKTDESIAYQVLDSLDRSELYSEEDVVEVFIRANSGGTRLGKSDLLFSLLIAAWDEADTRIGDLLDKLNAKGYAFNRDFVLKTCLTLLDKGARYEIDKFRDTQTKELIEAKWEQISAAILDVQDYLYGKTFVRSDKAMPSYLALIPLIYFRYHFPEKWAAAKGREPYLIRTLLTGAFSGLPDQLIDNIVARLREDRDFQVDHVFDVIRAGGRSLEITADKLLTSGYGSDAVHLLFNLWYEFNYTPAYQNNLPQVDHIFPQSLLRKVKVAGAGGRLNTLKYRDADRNQLANCMLLTAAENGAGGKSDTPPAEWFDGKPPEYLDLHLIPADRDLWNLENFEAFIEARKVLILKKFDGLLQRSAVG